MRKSLIFYLSVVILLFVLPGCGPNLGGYPSPTPTSMVTATPTAALISHLVTINVFDKITDEPLTGVLLTILETNQSMNINNNPYQNTFDQGRYTMYFSKSGYLTRGYVFDMASNLTLNVYLKQNNSIVTYENVSGKVLENGADYTSAFNVYSGNRLTANYTDDIVHPKGLFTVSSVCGDIAVSAYTKNGDSINNIKYLKTTLNPGDPINNLSLELSNVPLNYSGSKPAGDLLVVKQNEGYVLARQINNETHYSFGVALLPGNSVVLESSKTVNDTSYFTKVNAGSIGGTVNLQYQSTDPAFTVISSGNYYEVDFSAIDFASYYEVYAIQITGSEGIVPFQVMGLSGTSIKVPKSLFDIDADATFIYLRAINLAGYNVNNILNGTQNYQNYSYNEKMQSFNPGSLSLDFISKNQFQSMDRIIINTKTRLNLNNLCSE